MEVARKHNIFVYYDCSCLDGDEQLSKEELEVAEEVVDIVDADASCLRLLKSGKLKHRDLEKTVSAEKAVIIRRKYLEDEISVNFSDIPFENYDWQLVSFDPQHFINASVYFRLKELAVKIQ